MRIVEFLWFVLGTLLIPHVSGLKGVDQSPEQYSSNYNMRLSRRTGRKNFVPRGDRDTGDRRGGKPRSAPKPKPRKKRKHVALPPITSRPTVPPTTSPPTAPPTTRSPTPSPISNPTNSTTVGVYYYPWHSNDFHGGKYLRADLEPKQYPALGEYDDRKASVIAKHLEWSKYANINLWVSAWWGPGRRTDTTLKDYILPHDDLPDSGVKIALLYETTGRIDTNALNDTAVATRRVYDDIDYVAKNYFDDDNYHRIDGRPVVLIYISRWLETYELLDEVVGLMRNASADNGHDVYIIGDQVWGNAPGDDYEPFEILDAVTNYDVYGNMNRKYYAAQDGVDSYHAKQVAWKNAAKRQNCGFIPSVTPGFNDAAVRDGHIPVSRKLSETSEFGTLFKANLANALTILDDATGSMFLITSFNEWHEDTQIEPVEDNVFQLDLNRTTNLPTNLTYGLEYQRYGTLYLQLLRDATSLPSRSIL
mmetsp:Transcript_16720/g.25951  ORF Transcript_16720/g.25951 Transcript_16720/m.25951 type:complete len:477 (-) Transcript_16720:15-1445(-)